MRLSRKLNNRKNGAGSHIKLIILLSLGLFLFCNIHSQNNLIQNGGFEDGLTGWTHWDAALAISNDAHSGENAALVTDRGETWEAIVKDVTGNLVNGNHYKLKAWVKLLQASANFRATLQLTADGISTYSNFFYTPEPEIDTYISYSQDFIVEWEGTLEAANIYFETEAVNSIFTDYLIDDVELIEVILDTVPVPLRKGLKDIKSTMQMGGVVTDGLRTYFTSETAKSQFLSDCSTAQVQCYPAWGRWDESIKYVYHIEEFSEQVRELKEEGIPVTAHMLMGWDQYYPDWFKNVVFEADTLDSLMHSWIKTIIESNGNDTLVDMWNVVNEAISWDGQGGYFPLFNEDFNTACEFQRMGFEADASGLSGNQKVNDEHPVYIRKAFEYARLYTDKKLELRDVSMEFPNDQKYDAFYQLVLHLKNLGTPIDVIGFQTHLNLGVNYDWDAYIGNIKRFKDLGYEVNITEVDVGDIDLDWSDDKAQMQKVVYYQLVKAGIEAGANEFHTWGFVDGNNVDWRGEEHAFIFTEYFEMKPAYYGIEEALIDMSHILYWRMDHERDGRIPDIMQYANDGTIYNNESPVFTEGFSSNALQFDGIDDYLSVDQLSDTIKQDFSVSFFVRTESEEASTLLSLANAEGEEFSIGVKAGGSIFLQTDKEILQSPTIITDNNWHHISVRRDSSYFTLYVDNTTPVVGTEDNISFYSQFALGAKSDGSDAFSGFFDEVKLYDWLIDETSLSRSKIPLRPMYLDFSYNSIIPKVNLKWNDVSDNENGFTIELKVGEAEWTELAQVERGITTYANTMELKNTEYRYRIKAFNQFGISEQSNIVMQRSPQNPTSSLENEFDLNDDFKIFIYPNPVAEQLTVVSENNASLKIFSSQGRLIHNVENIRKEEFINVQPFPRGIYILQTIYNNKVVLQRFVKV